MKRKTNEHGVVAKGKLTKEERREKYTALARQQQDRLRKKDVVCFKCRKRGHAIVDCPDVTNKEAATASGKKRQRRKETIHVATVTLCYRCGSTEHTLSACPSSKIEEQNDNGFDNQFSTGTKSGLGFLPFATCFVCKEVGHIASQCPNNQHGIYVRGDGCCKECGSKFHRAVHCPEKKSLSKTNTQVLAKTEDYSDLIDHSIGSKSVDKELQRKEHESTASSMTTSNDLTEPVLKKRRMIKF